jgi:hypothetical protein
VCAIPRETRSSQRLVRLRSDPEGWLVDAEYSLDAYCVANETLLVRHKRVLSARRRLFGQSLGRHARWYDEVVGDGIGPLRASVGSGSISGVQFTGVWNRRHVGCLVMLRGS